MAWTWTIPTARCKTISSWLVSVRTLQALATFLTTVLNGALLAYIHAQVQKIPETLYGLEFMAILSFIYAAIGLLILRCGRRKQRNLMTKTIVMFIACDVLFVGLMIAIITILARSGVPATCHSLIRYNSEDGDTFNDRRRDDDDDDDEDPEDNEDRLKSLLDRYCSVEKLFYCLAIILIYSYIVSIVLSVLRILEPLYTKNDLIATAGNPYQLEYMGSKEHRPKSIADIDDPSSPLQGVVLTDVASSSSLPASRIISNNSRPRPASPTPAVSVSTLPSIPPRDPSSQATFSVSPVTPPTRSPVDQQRPTEDVGAYQNTMYDVAEAAMITDGYRHSPMSGFTTLPPYTPGPSRQFMDGHGNECNETRLSEYVKGQTRAQTMKDAGGGF